MPSWIIVIGLGAIANFFLYLIIKSFSKKRFYQLLFTYLAGFLTIIYAFKFAEGWDFIGWLLISIGALIFSIVFSLRFVCQYFKQRFKEKVSN